MTKRNKKKKLYAVHYEYTTSGVTYVKADSEKQARQVAEDDSAYPFGKVIVKVTGPDDLIGDELILNEDGSYT